MHGGGMVCVAGGRACIAGVCVVEGKHVWWGVVHGRGTCVGGMWEGVNRGHA